MNHSFALHTMGTIQLSLKWTGGEWGMWLDVQPRIGFLIHPNGEMMKTLSDKAVTNQSHCESQRTVKDISGQSSQALVRRGRPVTANSHAALFTLQSHRKALCSGYFLFHPITVLLFPHSTTLHAFLSFVFVIPSSRSVLLLEARQRDTGSVDRSGQVVVCYTEDSGVTAEPVWSVVVTKANVPPKHTGIHPKLHHSCQHANMSIKPGTL